MSLTKGANISLTDLRPGLRQVLVAMGWNPPTDDFQLDLSVLLLGADARVPNDEYVVFASQLQAAETQSSSDGEALGTDDEQLEVDLDTAPGYVHRMVFVASIYNAAARRQTFGQIEHLFIRVVDRAEDSELVRYTLDHDCAGETALAFGELYRHNNGWKFRAVGQGWSDGMAGLTRDYGAGL